MQPTFPGACHLALAAILAGGCALETPQPTPASDQDAAGVSGKADGSGASPVEPIALLWLEGDRGTIRLEGRNVFTGTMKPAGESELSRQVIPEAGGDCGALVLSKWSPDVDDELLPYCIAVEWRPAEGEADRDCPDYAYLDGAYEGYTDTFEGVFARFPDTPSR
ncbi:MAG: hypothetical protein JRI23_12750 [Deltaproteobacteria bacterium]|nr:hypothetical protein [Deltaproteobacteria bacterium]MBW2532584.1 hypothetical protein [Deltaproteobacteria bacterium]